MCTLKVNQHSKVTTANYIWKDEKKPITAGNVTKRLLVLSNIIFILWFIGNFFKCRLNVTIPIKNAYFEHYPSNQKMKKKTFSEHGQKKTWECNVEFVEKFSPEIKLFLFIVILRLMTQNLKR